MSTDPWTDLAIQFADSYQCPDCNPDKVLSRDANGFWRLEVMHDDTCPTYRSINSGENS